MSLADQSSDEIDACADNAALLEPDEGSQPSPGRDARATTNAGLGWKDVAGLANSQTRDCPGASTRWCVASAPPLAVPSSTWGREVVTLSRVLFCRCESGGLDVVGDGVLEGFECLADFGLGGWFVGVEQGP